MKRKSDIRFILDTDRDDYGNSYVTCKLSTVVMTWDDKKGQQVSNPGYFYYDDPDRATNCLNDLVISAQASTVSEDSNGETPRAEWYGWSVSYLQPYNVTLERAQEMVKVLSKVKRGLDQHEKEFGRPESFPAYALLVARIIGAHESNPFGIRSTTERPDWDGSGFRWQDSDGLRYTLQDTATGKLATTRRH